jgi:predicted phosphodiesterase
MDFPAPRQRRLPTLGWAKALLVTLAAALAAAPLAAVWGIGHARVEDYLGPHQAQFATNYSGELQIDLGPIGNAYLPSPDAPIGVVITVNGVGGSAETAGSLFSEQTLAAYTSLYTDPAGVTQGILERLRDRAVMEAVKAEAVLLLIFVGYRLRRHWLAGRIARRLTPWRGMAVYASVLVLVIGSALAPDPRPDPRIPVTVATGNARLNGLTVDSVLLADLLDRGIKGVILLAGRQQRAVNDYVAKATASLSNQVGVLPAPRDGEMMLLGISDLHCNQATTALITRLATMTKPALVLSSGDDTVNGTAAERGCVSREAAIAGDTPFVVATGNHDSDLTENQMASDGMIVLGGGPVEAVGVTVLGDDDPEHNLPFSVERTRDRAETEQELGQRMVETAAARQADVILVHQPAAASVIMGAADLPARLVLWGHFHSESGPTVVWHTDGSWTVGMRESTAGGVRQPTFTSFSTPFSPPLISADVYFYYRDIATGLITGVQPVRFQPDGRVVIEDRIATGDLDRLPADTRARLGATPSSPPGAETPR